MTSTSKTVVVSQPMFLPWLGMFEQVALADVFIHYDDVQLPQGRSLISRVQLKNTDSKQTWLTEPVKHKSNGSNINETLLQEGDIWREKHLKKIRYIYNKSEYFNEMFKLVEHIYNNKEQNLAEFNIYAIEFISDWLGLSTNFKKSSELSIVGNSSKRLCDICISEDANKYVTGLGALKYLDHQLFENNDISVEYMDYKMTPYTQLYGDFIPYVSILDLIANMGKNSASLISSNAINWKGLISDE